MRRIVSSSGFAITLAAGSGVLALWILARFAKFGPRTVAWAVIHVVIACVALLLVLPVAFDAISASGIPAAIYIQVFGVALPLLVYAFLTGGWTARVAMGMLR
jgi:hypothetical protein